MDYLWSPWRYKYLSGVGHDSRACIFCIGSEVADDASRLVCHRGEKNFIILNRYPYTSGHVMIAPFSHVGRFQDLDPAQYSEMMALAQRAMRTLDRVYRPQGYNVGMNLGECAGAGVKDHLHLHVVPRWFGDSNFTTVVGETRVLPEDLPVTLRRFQEAFQSVPSDLAS